MKNLEVTLEDSQNYYFTIHHFVIFWKKSDNTAT